MRKKSRIQMDLKRKTSRLCVFCGILFGSTQGLLAHHERCKLNTTKSKVNKHKPIGSVCHYICADCGKSFSFRSGLSRHKLICSRNDLQTYTCDTCNSTFTRIDNLKMHVRKCSNFMKKSCKFKCMYENCMYAFFHKKKLTEHLKMFHDSKIDEEQCIEFESFKEFLEWKQLEELQTHSSFIQYCGIKRGYVYYYCQYDKLHSKLSKFLIEGQNKNRKKMCLAKISVRITSNGHCTVVYQRTHNHNLIVADSPLLTKIVKFINNQLTKGVSPKACYTDINGPIFQDFDGVTSLQESKPIFVNSECTKRIKLKSSNNDILSVMIRTILLSKEVSNPVIVYKPLGANTVIGPTKIDRFPNAKDVFMLGLQTERHANRLATTSSAVLSISVSDGINICGYPFLTLVITDEHNRGYPIGFFIASSMNYEIILCFFKALKLRRPDLFKVINCIVVPQNPAIYDAIRDGLQLDVPYIWCLLDVNRSFQQELYELVPQTLVQEMYNSLYEIIECKKHELQNLVDNFVIEYSEIAPKFIEYFKGKYLVNTEWWVRSYRDFPHHNIDTTVFNEKVHNRIKQGILKESDSQRLDTLLNTFLDIEEEDYRQLTMEAMYNMPLGIGSINVCHNNALRIPDSDVTKVHDTFWIFNTEDELVAHYEVVKCSNNCTNTTCLFTCDTIECSHTCSHMFACTCPDKSPLCKHIHKVQELAYRQELLSDSLLKNKNITYDLKTLHKIFEYSTQCLEFTKENNMPVELVEEMRNCYDEIIANVGETSLEEEANETTNSIKNIIGYMNQFLNYIEHIPHMEICLEKIIEEYRSLFELENIKLEYNVQPSENLQDETNKENGFIPSSNFAKLTDIVLKYETEELAFIHLKLLDPYLIVEDISSIRNCEKMYITMYSNIINAFFSELQERYDHLITIPSDFAFILARNITINLVHFTKKDIAIMPMNLSHNFWTCIAICSLRNEIIYFNPMEIGFELDNVVIEKLLDVLYTNVVWRVINVKGTFLNDNSGGAIQVCHFAEQVSLNHTQLTLSTPQMYNKHIYETIVGGCLKREHYRDTGCGKCNKDSCSLADEGTAELSICCEKCNQWFHLYCVGLQTIDVSYVKFICPA